jgi:glutaredoxin
MKNAEEVAREVYLSCKETDFEPVYTRKMFATALKDYAEERVREAKSQWDHSMIEEKTIPCPWCKRDVRIDHLTDEAHALGFREGVEKAAKEVDEGGVNLNPYHERRDAIARVRALLPISAEKEKP